MGIRIISGGGYHDWIDDAPRERRRELVDMGLDRLLGNYTPMVCLHCETKAWRERGTGRLQILLTDESIGPRSPNFRSLEGPEKSCDFMIVRKVMET